MKVKVEKHHVFVEVPYVAKDVATQDLAGVWSAKERMYRFPKNLHVMAELLEYFPELKNAKSFMTAGAKLRAIREMFLDLKRPADAPGDERLRPYQRVDVQYLKKVPAAGIFNQPRTGKTPTSIILMKELKTRVNLVICPASLIFNWENEFKIWYPEMMTFVVHGTKKKKVNAFYDFEEVVSTTADKAVLIISKDTWKTMHKEFGGGEYDACFVDEAHFLRNTKTLQSRAIQKIHAKRRYALTGTPAVKGTDDVFGILQFLYPEKYTSYWQFIDRYFEINENWMGQREVGKVNPKRKAELEELIGFTSVQRKRKDVMKWLPDKIRQNIYVEMGTKQRKLYNDMVEWFCAYDEDTGHEVDTMDALSKLMRMRQICLDPSLVGFECDSAKTTALLDWLADNNEPVVIMSMFTSYLKKLKTTLEGKKYKVGMINGEMSNKDKFSEAERFQAGKSQVLLCNAISAGTGFTLDKAEIIIFTDKAWNPAENEQAEDRITPTTEAKNHSHTIISLICRDSFDETLDHILNNKQSMTDIINSGGMAAIQRLLRGGNFDAQGNS
jgi:SNF2 family DNA or RNA helicase